MELFDYISEEDKKALTDWIEINKSCTIPDLKKVLQYWEKNNKTLFKLLGNTLQYKTFIDIEMDVNVYRRQLQEIYASPQIRRYSDRLYLWDPPRNEFINDVFEYIFSLDWERKNEIWVSRILSFKDPYAGVYDLAHLFSHCNVQDGYTYRDFEISFLDKKPLSIKAHTKIMRAIRKFLLYINYPHMNLFEQWRNEISNLTTAKRIKGKLVLSIHPLDYLTLSDNNCGWDSCMRMKFNDPGTYSSALTEMMNSNCAIVAYLESNHTKFVFNFNDISNKSWRQLFYCHKDIICAGKSYPYSSDDLTKKVLEIISELAHQNLGWEYKYGPQLYKDIHCSSGRTTRNYKLKEDKKQIILYTYGYYNDFAADHGTHYWCLRNPISKGKKISVSGPTTCLVCGGKLYNSIEYLKHLAEEEIINDFYGKGICDECMRHKCGHCGRINLKTPVYRIDSYSHYLYYNILCDECVKDAEVQRQYLTNYIKDDGELDYDELGRRLVYPNSNSI